MGRSSTRRSPPSTARCSSTSPTSSSSTGSARETFDLALASKLVRQGGAVVRNDFRLTGPERVIVVTGPNQGGKTTLARAFGQLHFLAGLGCPVPGEEAELPLTDAVSAHFGREEQLADRRGRLEGEALFRRIFASP